MRYQLLLFCFSWHVSVRKRNICHNFLAISGTVDNYIFRIFFKFAIFLSLLRWPSVKFLTSRLHNPIWLGDLGNEKNNFLFCNISPLISKFVGPLLTCWAWAKKDLFSEQDRNKKLLLVVFGCMCQFLIRSLRFVLFCSFIVITHIYKISNLDTNWAWDTNFLRVTFLRTLSMQQKIHYFRKGVQNEILPDIHYLNWNSFSYEAHRVINFFYFDTCVVV